MAHRFFGMNDGVPTILLVEDEALLREGLQEILEVHGFKVIGAADGAEALELMTEALLFVRPIRSERLHMQFQVQV